MCEVINHPDVYGRDHTQWCYVAKEDGTYTFTFIIIIIIIISSSMLNQFSSHQLTIIIIIMLLCLSSIVLVFSQTDHVMTRFFFIYGGSCTFPSTVNARDLQAPNLQTFKAKNATEEWMNWMKMEDRPTRTKRYPKKQNKTKQTKLFSFLFFSSFIERILPPVHEFYLWSLWGCWSLCCFGNQRTPSSRFPLHTPHHSELCFAKQIKTRWCEHFFFFQKACIWMRGGSFNLRFYIRLSSWCFPMRWCVCRWSQCQES